MIFKMKLIDLRRKKAIVLNKRKTNGFMIILFLMLLFLIPSVFGQSDGTTIYNFLNNNYSTRSAALSGNLGLYNADADVQLDNPAGLIELDSPQICANYGRHFLDFYGGYLSYAFAKRQWGVLALGMVYFNYGDFDETDELGGATGAAFSASEMALVLSYANHLVDSVNFGANVKLISSNLANYSSYGLALDLSFDWKPEFLNNGKVLLIMTNAGSQLSTYNGKKEFIPFSFSFGVSHRPEHLPITLAVMLRDINYQANSLSDRLQRFAISAEFQMSRVFTIRTGYDNKKRIDLAQNGSNGFGGISFGIGIKVGSVRIDYALGMMNVLGNIHNFGIVWNL